MNPTDTISRQKATRWLTVKGIGDYCMVSPGTVRKWIKDEKLAATRLPSSHYRVSIEDFRDFLRRNDMPLKEDLFGSES